MEIGGRVRLPRGYLQRTVEHETRVHSRDIRTRARTRDKLGRTEEIRRTGNLRAKSYTGFRDSVGIRVIKNDIDRNQINNK